MRKTLGMKIVAYIGALAFALGLCSAATLQGRFSSKENIASVAFPLKELGTNLPDNWESFRFLVLEIRSSTAQRFLLGIDTNNGLHEKRTHVFPKAWVRLSIQLEYFREKPQPGTDLAATVNKPLTVGFMHIEGGSVGPLTGVKGLSIKFYTPLNNPVVEIRSVRLENENPGSAYLETFPFVDAFGQWALSDFEGKVSSAEALRKIWDAEEASLKPLQVKVSKYGGYLSETHRATGFFRVEKLNGRWWFIDPEGHPFLSIGMNGIGPGGGGGYSQAPGLEHVFAIIPETPAPQTGQNGQSGPAGGFRRTPSFGELNQQMRYGENWREKWTDLTLRRMEAWGINTGSIRENTKPYMVHLGNYGVSQVFGLQDVYVPDYAQRVEQAVQRTVSQHKDSPWLIGYFLQNEPSWLEQEARVCELILSGTGIPLKEALQEYLKAGDTPQRRTEFVHQTFRKHIETVSRFLRQYDPNHLSLGIRFGHATVPHPAILKICKDFFDVFSFNTYRLSPNMDYVNEVSRAIDLPMILGEFHFGTVDRGMAPGLVQVANQKERAVAFRYFAENAFAHPALIGISWFQYTDQGLLGRGDGERYNIGIVDVTDQPYPIVKGIMEAATHAYEIHAGKRNPSTRIPLGLRGNEDDLKSRSNQ